MQNFLPILIDLSSSIQLSFLTLPFLIRPCVVFIHNPLGVDIGCVDLISCHHLPYRLEGRFALRKVFRVLCYLTYICTYIRTPISYSKRKVIHYLVRIITLTFIETPVLRFIFLYFHTKIFLSQWYRRALSDRLGFQESACIIY